MGNEDCYLNADSPKCHLLEQAQNNLKALKSKKSKKTEFKRLQVASNVQFCEEQADRVNSVKKEPAIIDDGASTSMF